jgi:hypothetical protein
MGRWKWFMFALLILLIVAAGLAWTQRERIDSWYTLRGLSSADASTRGPWLDRVARLGPVTIEPLFAMLAQEAATPRENALAAIDRLVSEQGCEDSLSLDILQRLTRVFDKLPPDLQSAAITAVARWAQPTQGQDSWRDAATGLMTQASHCQQPDVQAANLELASALVRLLGPRSEKNAQHSQELLKSARDLARIGFQSSSASVRCKAVQLCCHAEMNLLEAVVPLLRDEDVTVRRAAIVAVGPADQLVREEVLLPGLHDSDGEVQRLTEIALRGRGLRNDHIELGRLFSHPKALSRLQVLDHIHDLLEQIRNGADSDLDPGAWLRRLSQDNSPAVRAGAVRLMSQQSLIDLSDRLEQMSRSDPSPTVSQLAQFYLKSKQTPSRVDR